MKHPYIAHPFLFAVFPSLFLFSHNVREVTCIETVLPTAASVTLAGIVFLGCRIAFRNRLKAGVLASAYLLAFFSDGHLARTVRWALSRPHLSHCYLFSFWALVLGTTTYWVVRTTRRLHNTTRILNATALVLVLTSAAHITAHKVGACLAWRAPSAAGCVEIDVSRLPREEPLRDIYYFIIERYPSESVLRDAYRFDNSRFIDHLTSRGFYVASESTSNYLVTAQSLASSLNMEYINSLAEQVPENFNDLIPLYWMLRDYKVWRSLRSVGYEFVHFGDAWYPTSRNQHADRNFNYYRVPELVIQLYERTALYPIGFRLRWGFEHAQMAKWRSVQSQFTNIAKIPRSGRPMFVFAHLLVTHPPYVFDRHGHYRYTQDTTWTAESQAHLDAIVYANAKLTGLIDRILSRSRVKPIIVLQSDEGPFPENSYCDRGQVFNWTKASAEDLRHKMSILNAYYLPGVDTNVLYPSITPVNSFRLILNLYFKTRLELLPDRNYVFPDASHVYELCDVTETIGHH